MRSFVVVAWVLVAVTGTAVAQSSPPLTYVSVPPPERTVSLTISPIHLLFPVVELTGEFRAGPALGVAAIGGLGTLKANVNGSDEKLFAAELGASVRYYPTRSFQGGLQLGAEALYIYVSLDQSSELDGATGVANGLSLGPFVGYKWIASGGFTFDGQLGVAYATARANASNSSSSSMSQSSSVIPLLNLNIGWSF